MVKFPIGTTRVVRCFVLRMQIGDEVKYLQFCSWEEEWREYTISDMPVPYSKEKFFPTKFIPEQEFYSRFATS